MTIANKMDSSIFITNQACCNSMLSWVLAVSWVWYYCLHAESGEGMQQDGLSITWTASLLIKLTNEQASQKIKSGFCVSARRTISCGSKATGSAEQGFVRKRERMSCGETMQSDAWLLSLWFGLIDDWFFKESAGEIHSWFLSSCETGQSPGSQIAFVSYSQGHETDRCLDKKVKLKYHCLALSLSFFQGMMLFFCGTKCTPKLKNVGVHK